MNPINGMKYFKAVTYDNNEYNFAVTPDNKIYCIEFGNIDPADRIELNPNFVLRAKCGKTICSLDEYHRNIGKKKTNESLISQWIIDEDVFKYLKDNKIISYSRFVADIYGFDTDYASDKFYHQNPHKRKRKKETEKKFARIRAGNFN